ERRREGHAALLALLDVVFGLLELVLDEFELRPLGEVLDREDGAEYLLQTHAGPLLGRRVHLQESVVRALLDLDQVRHRRNLVGASEGLAYALPAGERLRHRIPSSGAANGPPLSKSVQAHSGGGAGHGRQQARHCRPWQQRLTSRRPWRRP